MITEIKAAAKDGDSLGGVIEVLGFGVPVGLGSHVHWDRKLDALLAQAVMSIQAVKGVEIGDGFEVAGRRGSAAHDPIRWDGDANRYRRLSTLAGGTEGGMSTGELLVVRAAMKPLATLNVPTLETVDTATKESAVSFKERTDVTAVPAMGVVAETMVALVLAGEAQRKFGGDSVTEFVRNAEAFAATIAVRPMTPRRACRDDGVGQDHGRPDRCRAAGPAVLRLRRARRGAHRPHRAADLVRRGRGGVPGPRDAGVARRPRRARRPASSPPPEEWC